MAMKLSRLHHSFRYSHPVVTDLQMHSSETVAHFYRDFGPLGMLNGVSNYFHCNTIDFVTRRWLQRADSAV